MRSSRLLVVGVDEASSLKDEAMAKIKKDAGFDPKEPPEHNTDINGLRGSRGLYLKRLDVSAPPHNPKHPRSAPSVSSTPSAPSAPCFRTIRVRSNAPSALRSPHPCCRPPRRHSPSCLCARRRGSCSRASSRWSARSVPAVGGLRIGSLPPVARLERQPSSAGRAHADRLHNDATVRHQGSPGPLRCASSSRGSAAVPRTSLCQRRREAPNHQRRRTRTASSLSMPSACTTHHASSCACFRSSSSSVPPRAAHLHCSRTSCIIRVFFRLAPRSSVAGYCGREPGTSLAWFQARATQTLH